MRSSSLKPGAGALIAVLIMLASSCMPAARTQKKELSDNNDEVTAGSRSARLFAPLPVGEHIEMQ